jgi:2-polyprenyl-3-methyl-5-hydroxy-6-metoxy-1,4-benzoquinol methylase/uncharacterized protein YbaR (Trm112 family)
LGSFSGCVCPACRNNIEFFDNHFICSNCHRRYPGVAGLPDLRLAPDRYFGLDDDRAKARRLSALEPTTDVMGLARAYYAMTDDVEPRRQRRFLAHIARAEERGATLAALLPRGGMVLEVGCGTGGLLVAAARMGINIIGAEIAVRWLVVARRRLADRGVSVPLVGASVEALPWPDATFDVVVADSVFEHVGDPALALRECWRVLRPGGHLVAWSPNRFTIARDPHVHLWGVGWLPRPWAAAYVRWRRGRAWTVQPLSARAARRLAVAAGFQDVSIEAPDVPERWAEGQSRALRWTVRGYGIVRRLPGSRRLLLALGPLWRLEAVKEKS